MTRLPLHYLLPCLLAVAVFWPTLGFGLLNWDDQLHLTGNPYLATPGKFWVEPYGKLYIPVAYSVWAAVWPLCVDGSGQLATAVPLRVLNLATHAMNVALVVAVLRTLKFGKSAAAVGAAVFAVHPIQTEAVAWVSEFRGLSAATFSLTCMLLYWRQRWAWAAVALAAALLCKPSAAAVPVMLLAVVEVAAPGKRLKAFGHLLPQFVLAAVVTAGMAVWIQSTDDPQLAVPWHLRLLVACDAVRHYLASVLLPYGYTADYSRTPALAMQTTWFWWSWAVPAGLAAAAWKWKLIRVPVIFGVGALVPVLGLVPFEFQRISTVADRYAYLAMLGVASGAAVMWQAAFFMKQSPQWRTQKSGGQLNLGLQIQMMISVMILCFGLTTSVREVWHWRDDRTLWTRAVEVSELSGSGAVVARCNLAEMASTRGEKAEAKRLFEEAHRADPRRASPMVGLAKLARDAGDVEGAEGWYRKAMEADPADPVPATDLGSLLIQTGRAAEAQKVLRTAIARHPRYADLRINLAGALQGQGRREEAVAEAREAIRLNPRHPRGHLLLAVLTGDEALAKRALELDPDETDAMKWLGSRALSGGRWEEAEAMYGGVVKRWPRDAVAWNNLGRTRVAGGKVAEAVAAFEKAVELLPGNVAARENLEKARELLGTGRP